MSDITAVEFLKAQVKHKLQENAKLSARVAELEAKLAALEGQEPVAWIPSERENNYHYHDSVTAYRTRKAGGTALYTHPPKRQPMTDTVAQVAGYASPPLVLSVALCAEDIKAIYAWRTAIEAHIKGARE